MKRLYCPSRGPADWKALLAEPEKHWRVGYSAMAFSSCWEDAIGGLPPEIADLFEGRELSPELLLGLIEHKVPLPGSKRGDSQSDLFALIRVGETTFAATIEGKVDEPFDKQLSEWLANASEGKRERLDYICNLLGLTQPLPGTIYYQLLQRSAAAVIEARRFKTDAACMIVHSFSSTGRWYDAFAEFVSLFGANAQRGQLLSIMPSGTPPLYVAWAAGDARFLAIADPLGPGGSE